MTSRAKITLGIGVFLLLTAALDTWAAVVAYNASDSNAGGTYVISAVILLVIGAALVWWSRRPRQSV